MPLTDSLCVLLVEDNPVASKVAMRILEECQCKVDSAETGNVALTLATENKYSLIFMDIGLPDIDGLTLTETIRKSEKNADTPIIAITSHDDNTSQNQATWVGMDDFIIKPLTPEKCQRVIALFSKGRKKLKTDL